MIARNKRNEQLMVDPTISRMAQLFQQRTTVYFDSTFLPWSFCLEAVSSPVL